MSVVVVGGYHVDGFVTLVGGGSEEGGYLPLNAVEEVAGVPLSDVLTHLEACINGRYDLGVAPTKGVSQDTLQTMFPTPRSLSKREQKRRRERVPEDGDVDEGPVPDSYGWVPTTDDGGWQFCFRPSPPPAGHVYLVPSIPTPRRTLHIIDPHLSDSVIRALVLSPQLGKLVAEVTGWGEGCVRVLESQLWLKPPQCTMPLAFHRDTPYFNFLATHDASGAEVPVEVSTLWITFDDVSSWESAMSRGALEYVKGSHLWGSKGGTPKPMWGCLGDKVGSDDDRAVEAPAAGAAPNSAPKGLQKVFFDTDYHAPMHSAAVHGFASVLPEGLTGTVTTKQHRSAQLRYLQEVGFLAPPSTTMYVGSTLPPIPRPSATPNGSSAPLMTHLVQLPAGGCTIHNGNTWHGSNCNTGTTADHWRRGIGIHYVHASARFKQCYAEAASSPSTRPLSAMWSPHKQVGVLDLCPKRFPVVY